MVLGQRFETLPDLIHNINSYDPTTQSTELLAI